MRTVLGVFNTAEQADHALDDLKRVISSAEQVRLLDPESDHLKFDSSRVNDTVDRRGLGIGIGAIVLGLAAVLVCWMIFGSPINGNWVGFVGPLIAVLVVGAGLIGAWLGATLADPYRRAAVQGISPEDFFFYRDAMQRGNYLIMATAMTDRRAEHMGKLMAQLGAVARDTVRESWWAGLRNNESDYYQENETVYRSGFEAALHPEMFNHTYDEAIAMLRAQYGNMADQEFFRRGYERGQQYVSRQHLPRAA